jgi:hypothetical protein
VALPLPEPGLVVSYSYLWHAEYAQGREEGIKNRPCIIVISVQEMGGKYLVTVAPVTHSTPSHPDTAVEIPAETKRRLGLDADRSWVVVNEVNDFVWPGPDIRPLPDETARFEYGFLPPGLYRRIRDRVTALGASGQLQSVPRTD